VDYFATQVAQDTYIQNLRQQLADKGRMLALSLPDAGRLDEEYARAMARAAGGRITVVRRTQSAGGLGSQRLGDETTARAPS